MSLARYRSDEIQIWTGRLLAIAGAALLVEAVSGLYGASLGGVPLSWLVTSIPFGIGFALVPLVVLGSYRYLVARTPTSALVGAAFVAALPIGTIVLVAWGALALAGAPIPQVTVLPVSVDVVFFTLLAAFAVGVATFGAAFLQSARTRLLGGSLLAFAMSWVVPLSAVKLTGVYPGWLADLLVVSVATTMIAIGYHYPPVASDGRQ